MKKIYRTSVALLVLLAAACNLDGDLQNPNEVTVSGADPTLIMNSVQLDFGDFFDNASAPVNRLVRMETMNGGFRYQTAFQPQNLDGVWNLAYRNVLINAETLIPLAASKGLTTHVAVAKIIEAYTFLTLVDVFGDVPQTEALLGATGNFNPKADNGASVYAKAISLLDEARVELAKTGTDAGAALLRDIYYGGDRTKWTALANSLELKAQLNLSMIPANAAAANARIAVLLTLNLVDTEAENFTYKYGTATVPGGSRHPSYDKYYGPSKGAAAGYICNSFLYELYKSKPDPANPTDPTKFTQDPRWRYYFYRQVGSIATMAAVDPKALGCTPAAPPNHYAGYPFCIFDPGFYGRDHGDASGTPPDSPFIVAFGVYPAGGRPDLNPTSGGGSYQGATQRGDGANGAGIQPIFMSFFTDYMKAEIQERATPGSSLPQLQTAISNSITQVANFATAKNQPVAASLIPSVTNYKNAVAYLYGNASRKMDIVGREFYVACFGNGVEAYNLYRRTSAPTNMQPTIQVGPGPWLRSMTYPAVYVNLNANGKQKDYTVTNKVFWDTNPDNLN